MRTYKNNHRKIILIIAILLALLLIGVGVFFFIHRNSQSTPTKGTPSSQNPSPSTPDTAPPNVDSKDNNNSDTVAPSDQLEVGITSANQNNSNLEIRVLVQASISTGECQLTLSKGASKVTKTVNVQALASNSTCQGFTVPISELSSGEWTIDITVTSPGSTGSTSGKVTITS